MNVYVAKFFINKGWGMRFDNEYKEIDMKVFKYKKDAKAWVRDMEAKSAYHSGSLITKQFIN